MRTQERNRILRMLAGQQRSLEADYRDARGYYELETRARTDYEATIERQQRAARYYRSYMRSREFWENDGFYGRPGAVFRRGDPE